MKDFADKVAAITGAASGIGRALALDLATRGCHLALSDVRADELRQTAELAAARGVRVTHAEVDVADRVAMYAWAAQAVRDHGGVNLIFNNAGVSVASTVHGLDYADFEWIMGINFWGVVYGTKAFLPHLKASGDGHVVNVSSMFGLFAQPGVSAYNSSKFAVRGFTESLRQELELMRWPVSATSVHPGGIKTNILRSIRYSPSMGELGLSSGARDATAGFEKMFITSAEQAARKILRAVTRNKRRILIGRDARFYDRMQRLLPSGYQRLAVSVLRRRAARR
jgi:NAD(P)-dependent dehydrogenase (short-subunit alcohol dehydrogenase family)